MRGSCRIQRKRPTYETVVLGPLKCRCIVINESNAVKRSSLFNFVAICAAALLIAGALAIAAEAPHAQSLKGYVTDTWCGVNRDTKPPTAACTRTCVKTQGAKYAFYNLADKKVYVLEPQNRVAAYAGETVIVRGTIGDDIQQLKTMRGDVGSETLTISSISKAD
jgi:hypothetical protein